MVSALSFGFFGFGGEYLVKVGGTKITEEDVQDRINSFPENVQAQLENEQVKERLINQMIDETILLEAAKKEGITRSDEYKKQLSQLKKQLLLSLYVQEKIENKITVTGDDVRAVYEANKNLYGEARNAQHILVKTEREANRIAARLKKGASFSDLAQEVSEDPGSKDRGGNLGWFTRGQLVPEFEAAVYALKNKGDISPAVKSEFGYHIIKLNDIRPPLELNEQVAQQIGNQIRQQKEQQIGNELLSSLKEKIKVVRKEKDDTNTQTESSETSEGNS